MKNPIKQYILRKKQRELQRRYMEYGAGTFLLRNDSLDFRLPPENRKYVTIGERGII